MNFPDVTTYFTPKNYEAEKRELLNELINCVREVQIQFSNTKELATCNNDSVAKLCDTWEKVLCHGIKTNLLDNVTELGSNFLGAKLIHSGQFWNFAYRQLTNHEKERYMALKNIWTERGRCKALIRNNLNEQSMERSLLIWLSCNLPEFYENWALIREEKCRDLLPKLARDLSKVLFAISIDQAEFNVSTATASKNTNVPEPIVSPPPAFRISGKNRREIDNFDETKNERSPPSYQIVRPVLEKPKSAAVPVVERSESPKLQETSKIGSISSISSLESSDIEFNEPTSQISKSSVPENPFEEPTSAEVEEKTSLRRSVSSITSSSISTVSSKPSEHIPTTNQVEEELREKIRQLENQISDLKLENTRLRNQIDAPKITSLSNFTVAIPKAVLKKSATKNYYTYEIIIKSKLDLDQWTIFKRYRDFYQLHKKLKKEHLTVKALDFPPKKKIGNMDFDFVEQRRQRLQVYLRHLISLLPEIASCDCRQSLEEKFPFLK